MTLHKPRLALRRLVIWANGKTAYNQVFKDGVNIIRGKNSSGKSTIADFIFYVLGGDFSKWKLEASMCDRVMAELDINGKPVTIRRSVEEKARQPMMIFWGNYDQANASAVAGWHVFPFQRGKPGETAPQKESFSQVLFRALEFPEVHGDLDSNVTMHQILRLIFVDQLSPVDSLLRTEQFDSAITRNAIGDLLLGSYDDLLYSSQILLAKKQKQIEGLTAEYDSAMQVFTEAGQETDIDTVTGQIDELNEQRTKVVAALRNLENLEVTKGNESRIQELRTELVKRQQTLAGLEEDNARLTFEVTDSQHFLQSLQSRLTALEDSNKVRSLLGDLPLTNCPHCLAPITVVSKSGICPLCKEESTDSTEASHSARMRQELTHQISESDFLLGKKQAQLDEVRRKLPSVSEEVNRFASEYSIAVSAAKTQRDEHIDKLWKTLGELDTKVEYLHKYARGITILCHLRDRKIAVEGEISRLKLTIAQKIQKQQLLKGEAFATIEKKTLYLLQNDLPLESAFKLATEIHIDFANNSFSVNGKNQFSASSMVYLKNSIRFAIFWASLELPFFRYPRLFISDDIEDKGMHPTRSQNFQRLLVSLSQEFEVAHQIIFTTSMIDPELDVSDHCVGPAYGPKNKTLCF